MSYWIVVVNGGVAIIVPIGSIRICSPRCSLWISCNGCSDVSSNLVCVVLLKSLLSFDIGHTVGYAALIPGNRVICVLFPDGGFPVVIALSVCYTVGFVGMQIACNLLCGCLVLATSVVHVC